LPFSFRHFLRQTPSRTSKAFFDGQGVDFGDAVDWRAAEHVIARQTAEAMDRMSGEQVAPLISGLERAHALSDEHGIRALVNAAEDPEAMLATFDQAETDQERALRVLVESPKAFEHAEDIRYFDYKVEGNYGRRFRAQRDSADIEKFQCAVGAYFRSIDGSGRSCVAEVIDRNADGTVQVTLFVEGLASNAVGFDKGGLYRRPQRPAIQAAVVYCGRTGTVETVAKGGKPVHEELRKLFAQQLLRIDPRFDGVRPRRFRLSTLAGRPTLPTSPEDGIETARVRRLKLLPISNRPGAIVIEAPSDRSDVSAHGLSAEWFQDWDPVARSFHIIQATISVHFRPVDGRRPRTIHLDLGFPAHAGQGEDLVARDGQRRDPDLRVLPRLRLARVARISRRRRYHQREGRLARPAPRPAIGHPYLDHAQAAGRGHPRRRQAIPRRTGLIFSGRPRPR
jgi:hypothetical protein